jgi:hypothetical protein
MRRGHALATLASVMVMMMAMSHHPAADGAPRSPMGPRVARASAKNRALFAAGEDPIVTRAAWPASPPGDHAALVSLGGEAFSLFPAGVDATWELRIGDDRALARAGVTIDTDGDAVGLLFVELDGQWRTAYSCMLCHSRREQDGALRIGPANAELRYGDLLADAYPDHPDATAWRAWGAGRVDVTPDGKMEPLRIPDLIGLNSVTYLQQSGAFAMVSARSLAQRIEAVLRRSPVDTALANGMSVALAAWLRELPQPASPRVGIATRTGERLFRARCARCHDGPALGGRSLVDASEVGTDDRAARDSLRGTGSYRVPPLLGAGSRARFFHDGSLTHLTDVIDPRRLDPHFAEGALGAGAVLGHPWGMSLDAQARRSIVAYLESSRW